MGYAPDGITRDVIKMSEKLKELEKERKYLLEHPKETEYNGQTMTEIEGAIYRIKHFEFLS